MNEQILEDLLESPWRGDFPVLSLKSHGNKDLSFLDSAASAQKPVCVIEAMNNVMRGGYSNIHRGLYEISQNLSQTYEDVRGKIADFINAPSDKNIVFTSGSTESINMVAHSWGRANLKVGDEIIITEMEHHANIVPWFLLAEQVGVVIKTVPVTSDYTLDIDAFESSLSDKTKFVALTEVSNVLGTINPVAEIISKVRCYNSSIKVLVDGSQGIVHHPVDVQVMDADFYAFTGHKLYGPTGIGVLYGKANALESMIPYQGGGDMIDKVSFKDGITYREPPFRFEAGTPPIIEAIGLGAAIDYLNKIGMDIINKHEEQLVSYADGVLRDIDGVSLYSTVDLEQKAGIFSFTLKDIHTSDTGMILDQCGVAVRTGHHCAMPLMEAIGVDSTVRASFGLYTNKNDIDALVNGIRKVQELCL